MTEKERLFYENHKYWVPQIACLPYEDKVILITLAGQIRSCIGLFTWEEAQEYIKHRTAKVQQDMQNQREQSERAYKQAQTEELALSSIKVEL